MLSLLSILASCFNHILAKSQGRSAGVFTALSHEKTQKNNRASGCKLHGDVSQALFSLCDLKNFDHGELTIGSADDFMKTWTCHQHLLPEQARVGMCEKCLVLPNGWGWSSSIASNCRCIQTLKLNCSLHLSSSPTSINKYPYLSIIRINIPHPDAEGSQNANWDCWAPYNFQSNVGGWPTHQANQMVVLLCTQGIDGHISWPFCLPETPRWNYALKIQFHPCMSVLSIFCITSVVHHNIIIMIWPFIRDH